MRLYRAVARPLLFSLPAEAAHRLTLGALALPLPWNVVGGVPSDLDLGVELAGLRLPNPIGLAAGFDKGCRRLGVLGRLGFGYVVGGTVTREPREGNPRPRVVRSVHRRSVVNAMGLPNPGADAVAKALAATPRTTPRVASIADEPVEDVVAVHAVLAPLVDAIELNVSCPNVSWGRDRDSEAHLARLLGTIGRRGSSPVFVKLPPFRTARERDAVLALALIAVDEGAAALTCSNTRPVSDRRLATGAGGLSGAALTSDTPRIVEEVRDATDGAVPINACGGVSSGGDAIACLRAGATTVQLYTALLFEGPRLVGDIARELARDGGRWVPSAAGAPHGDRDPIAR
jgi:dihydroorotate dehydrogenase